MAAVIHTTWDNTVYGKHTVEQWAAHLLKHGWKNLGPRQLWTLRHKYSLAVEFIEEGDEDRAYITVNIEGLLPGSSGLEFRVRLASLAGLLQCSQDLPPALLMRIIEFQHMNVPDMPLYLRGVAGPFSPSHGTGWEIRSPSMKEGEYFLHVSCARGDAPRKNGMITGDLKWMNPDYAVCRIGAGGNVEYQGLGSGSIRPVGRVWGTGYNSQEIMLISDLIVHGSREAEVYLGSLPRLKSCPLWPSYVAHRGEEAR